MKKLAKILSLVMIFALVLSTAACVGTKVGQNDGRDSEGNLHFSVGGSPVEKKEEF